MRWLWKPAGGGLAANDQGASTATGEVNARPMAPRSTALAGAQLAARQLNCESVFRGVLSYGREQTGVATLNLEVGPKRLELLHELIPSAHIVALLGNPTNPVLTEPLSRDAQAGARALGLQLHVLHARNDAEIEAAFAAFHGLQAGGLVIGSDQFFN